MKAERVDLLDRIQKYLNENVWLGISLVLFFYVLILIFATGTFIRLVGSDFYNQHTYLGFIFRFALLVLYFFLIVPFLFNVPYSNMSFFRYLRNIKIAKYKPIIVIFGIGLITGGITLACMTLASKLSTLTNGTLDINWHIFYTERGSSLYTALIPGIFEEIVFRGIVLTLLLRRYKENIAIIISAILFSSFHLVNLINLFYIQPGSFSVEGVTILKNVAFQLIYTLAIGFFFGYVTLKTQSIIPAIICHYLVDAFGSLFQMVYNANLEIFLAWQTFIGIGFLPALANILFVRIIPKELLKLKVKQEQEDYQLSKELDIVIEDTSSEVD